LKVIKLIHAVKIPTGGRLTSGLFTKNEVLRPPNTDPSSGRDDDFSSIPPDHKSHTLNP